MLIGERGGGAGGYQVAQQAAVEQQSILQAHLDAELPVVGQRDFRDQHLNQHLRRLGVELFDQPVDLLVRSGARR